MKAIYLDYNASAPMPAAVLEAMLPYLKDNYGNASSLHQPGQKARKAIETARQTMAAFINAESPDEIIFTSGGTESNNLAIKGTVDLYEKNIKHIISCTIEHSAVKNVFSYLKDKKQAEVTTVPVHPNGILDLPAFEKSVTDNTILVSIMTANNEVGTLQPVAEVSKICRERNITFHSDAVQLAGKGNIDVQAMGVDMLSLSGHKFGGPKGVGLLYVRKGTRLEATIHGGRQEKNRRGGTENVAGIVGMAKAALIALEESTMVHARLKSLRDNFESKILKEIPASFINGDLKTRVPNTSNIGFDAIDSSEALMALDLNGVICSNGSACQAGSPEPSHVLLAMGLSREKAHSSLRFSLGPDTTKEDIERAVSIIKKIVQKLRENHPLWKK